jgi:hypothetical protein
MINPDAPAPNDQGLVDQPQPPDDAPPADEDAEAGTDATPEVAGDDAPPDEDDQAPEANPAGADDVPVEDADAADTEGDTDLGEEGGS